MAKEKILLPYNFTPYDEKAADFVIQTYGGRQDVLLTLFNAYIDAPEIETDANPIMSKMRSNLHYIAQAVAEQEVKLKELKQKFMGNGFSENQINIVFQPKKNDTASDIIRLAEKGKYNVVVLNHKPGQISRFFAGSVFNKVVTHLRSTAVCIVS